MNIIKHIFILLIFFNANYFVLAKEDTLSTALPNIKVTADRILSEQALKYNSFNLITKAEIAQKNPWQTFEILNTIPGIFINDYGGLGGLKTISMRGTSSSQSLLMIDGMRINSSQSAVADLSILPVSIFDEMEVVRGGASAIFGGNAIGGVVNMLSSDFDKNMLSLSMNVGSFDEYFVSAKSVFGTDQINQLFSAEYKTSTGDYTFIPGESNETYKRINSDFIMYSATSLTRYKIGTWNLSNRIMLNFSERNIPGPFIENNENDISSPSLNDRTVLLLISAVKAINPLSSLYIGLKANRNYYQYIDKNLYGDGYPEFDAEFTNNDFLFNLKYNFKSVIGNQSICFESGASNLSGNQLEYSTGSMVERYLLAVSGKVESEINIPKIGIIAYSYGLRFDTYTDAGNALSSFWGLLYNFSTFPVQIKTQISNNFRPPSFNEMYYLNFGNKDLKPEKSLSYNLGFIYNPLANLMFQLDGFYMNTDDRIISIPKSQVSWSAENISNVTNKGFELSANLKYFDKLLNLNFAYTFQDVRNTSFDDNNYGKLIVYMPQEILSGTLSLNYSDFSIGTSQRYSGHYFSLPDNSYESLMPGYFLLDVFLNYKFKFDVVDLHLRADCKNLLNEQYAIIKNYPMPGRFFRLGLTLNY